MKKVLLFSLSCILFTVLCSCNKSIEKSSSETTSDEYTSATITVEISSDATSDENAYATMASKTSSNCTWSLDGTVLTISGNGKMDLIDNKTKWGKDITEVVIQNGITSIESYAFSGFTNLTNVTIPDSVTTIGESAFERCS